MELLYSTWYICVISLHLFVMALLTNSIRSLSCNEEASDASIVFIESLTNLNFFCSKFEYDAHHNMSNYNFLCTFLYHTCNHLHDIKEYHYD